MRGHPRGSQDGDVRETRLPALLEPFWGAVDSSRSLLKAIVGRLGALLEPFRAVSASPGPPPEAVLELLWGRFWLLLGTPTQIQPITQLKLKSKSTPPQLNQLKLHST